MDAATLYAERRAARDTAVRDLETRAARISSARLLVALGAVALVAAIVWMPLPIEAWWVVLALVAAFAALVIAHGSVFARRERLAAARRFHERGLARLGGKWQTFPQNGDRFRSADHPYAGDLDIFGRASLFQLMDATETRFGEERLAGLLAGEEPDWDAVRERQVAVRELAGKIDFREKLAAAGAVVGGGRPDPTQFLAWAEGQAPYGPPWRARGAVVAASFVLPLVTVGTFVATRAAGLPPALALLPFFAELAVLRTLAERIARAAAAAMSQDRGFARFAEMLEVVEAESLSAPYLVAIKARLGSTGTAATLEMRKLARAIGFFEARENEIFRFFIGPVLLWDVHCLRALEAWRGHAGNAARGWLLALGEMEALASLASLAFDRPEYVFPEVVASAHFAAEGLGHPLIGGERRVVNDVTLSGPGTALVITGSNMSGKSTLLRAMGINAALAHAGAPVCARKLVIGPVRVVTSMRVSDSLESGVSHFYAEVARLKRVLDLARSGPGVLFLLDEILHGTNSRERLIGARAVTRELLRCGSLGGVSTHDLGIGDLEAELPSQVQNVHFQEQVEGDKMTFDYKLRRGVVQSSNALRLMRMVGIDVVPENA